MRDPAMHPVRSQPLEVPRTASAPGTKSEPRSLAELFHQEESALLGFAIGLVGRRSVAEELVLIKLKYNEDLKYQEISNRTGLSVGNVGYKLHHLLKGLADALRHAGIDGSRG